jgi:hypothetical protein
MSHVTPIAMVIDRASADDKLRRDMMELGGAWPEMYLLWLKTEMPYLIFLAHTRERLLHRAPLTLMPANDDALRQTLQHCFADMQGKRVKWLLLMEKDSVGREITASELLLDFAAGGNA